MDVRENVVLRPVAADVDEASVSVVGSPPLVVDLRCFIDFGPWAPS